MKLNEELQVLAKQKAQKRDTLVSKKMKQFSDELMSQRIVETSLQVGEVIPKLEFIDPFGNPTIIDSSKIETSIVLIFYRGNWCPYCNMTLRYYQSRIGEIKDTGARFIAVSPQTADNSLSMKEKYSLDFEVLSDVNNIGAKKLGLVFTLNSEILDLYKNFGHDLVKANGNDSYEIPVPATFVLNKEGVVVSRHVDTDYTKRMDVEDIVSFLK